MILPEPQPVRPRVFPSSSRNTEGRAHAAATERVDGAAVRTRRAAQRQARAEHALGVRRARERAHALYERTTDGRAARRRARARAGRAASDELLADCGALQPRLLNCLVHELERFWRETGEQALPVARARDSGADEVVELAHGVP